MADGQMGLKDCYVIYAQGGNVLVQGQGRDMLVEAEDIQLAKGDRMDAIKGALMNSNFNKDAPPTIPFDAKQSIVFDPDSNKYIEFEL